MLTRRSSRRSTALSAGLLFVTLLGCKKVKQLVSGKQESKCASFSACESACNGSDTLACIKLGDMHRTEAHGSLGKWDPEAAKAAYDKACKADLQLGCAKLASMSSYETIKSYELADKACKDKVALGCAVAGSILASGREYPDGKYLCLVRETKGTDQLEELQWESEGWKIKFGSAHFKELKVDYSWGNDPKVLIEVSPNVAAQGL